MRDKERLDAGEPTEIVASYTRVDVAGLDQLAAALSQTLLQSGKEIDVTPTESDTTKKRGSDDVRSYVCSVRQARTATAGENTSFPGRCIGWAYDHAGPAFTVQRQRKDFEAVGDLFNFNMKIVSFRGQICYVFVLAVGRIVDMGFSKFLASLFPAKAARPKQKEEDEPITVESKLRGWQIELDSGYALKKAADIIRRDNAKTNSATVP